MVEKGCQYIDSKVPRSRSKAEREQAGVLSARQRSRVKVAQQISVGTVASKSANWIADAIIIVVPQMYLGPRDHDDGPDA